MPVLLLGYLVWVKQMGGAEDFQLQRDDPGRRVKSSDDFLEGSSQSSQNCKYFVWIVWLLSARVSRALTILQTFIGDPKESSEKSWADVAKVVRVPKALTRIPR